VYTKDPSSALAKGDKKAVDTLQFPQETLASRNGDCDDLSILFCSMLESIGIETAIVTTPGHVFAAFLVGMRPEDAVKAYGRSSDFVVRDGKTWIPVELTALSSDFMGAWKEGAREWSAENGTAGFYPVRDAWKLFAPVVVSGAAKAPALPAAAKLTSGLKTNVQGLVARELSPRAEALIAEARKPGAPAKTLNSLGVLYARYGQYDKALEQFTKAAGKDAYRPAMVNIGNIYLAQKQYRQASEQFRKVLKIAPTDPFSLAGAAMAFDALGNRAEAGDAYAKLKTADPGLAEQLAYLDMTKADGGTRAAEADSKEAKIAWND
jgi:tetratricopeptide (TPR) repeat protein